jgi:hypothetical protein
VNIAALRAATKGSGYKKSALRQPFFMIRDRMRQGSRPKSATARNAFPPRHTHAVTSRDCDHLGEARRHRPHFVAARAARPALPTVMSDISLTRDREGARLSPSRDHVGQAILPAAGFQAGSFTLLPARSAFRFGTATVRERVPAPCVSLGPLPASRATARSAFRRGARFSVQRRT